MEGSSYRNQSQPQVKGPPTLNNWTPMHANMNWSKVVTIMMLPMVLMATKTHWTTCWGRE